jgi:hypothetical protein
MEQRKRKIVPVVAVELDDSSETDRIPKPKWCGIWIELCAVCILGLAAISNLSFWKDWFGTTDNLILGSCILLGSVGSLIQVHWNGAVTYSRLVMGILVWFAALIVLILSLTMPASIPSGSVLVTIGLVIAGWGAMRVHGENWGYGFGLGLAWCLPFAVLIFSGQGQFDRLETSAVRLTAGLADTIGLFHIRDNNSVLFGLGIADHFHSEGVYDSAICFLGFGIFLILVRRRGLIASIGTIACSLLVWVTVRALAWTVLVFWSDQSGVWNEWTFQIGIVTLVIGAFFTLNLDQLVATFLAPIPFEFVNPDFPLIAMTWNWLSGLPILYLSVPERERDFGSFEEATSR